MRELLGKQILYIYYDIKKKQSIVICENEYFGYPVSCLTLVRRLCTLYGTDYRWQQSYSKELLKIKQKAPIVIKESRKFVLFPLTNVRNKNNIWLNYGAIKKVEYFYYQFSLLYFNQQDVFCLRMNNRVINSQMKRCKLILEYLSTQ